MMIFPWRSTLALTTLGIVLLGFAGQARAAGNCDKKGTVTVSSFDSEELRQAIIEFCDPPPEKGGRTYCKVKDIRFEGPATDKKYTYTVECRDPS